LNFGMACEMANAEQRPCKMVIVADDCAIARCKGETGARGVAGTVFVHKAAGAAAAQGQTLEQVANVAAQVATRIGSLGVTLEAVTLPGATTVNKRLAGNKMEIGLGIHGEAGIRQSALLPSQEIAKEMVDTIYEFGYKPEGQDRVQKLQTDDSVVLLVNNLGGTSNFELSILARDLVRYLEGTLKCSVSRVMVGSFMTSFNMHGASASILCLEDDNLDFSIATLIDAPTDAPAWSNVDILNEKTRPSLSVLPEVKVEDGPSGTLEKENLVSIHEFGARATAAIAACCKALIEAEPKLTEWDTIVGDGDCGLTMARGATAVQNLLNEGKLSVEAPSKLFHQLADAISASMGGTSGILFELMLRRTGTYLANNGGAGSVDESMLKKAFAQGARAGSYYGGAKLGYRTMMDALLPAAEEADRDMGLAAMSAAATKGADSTALMTSALAGRSNYLSEEQLRSTPDPGAKAVSIILAAVAEAAA